MLLLRLARIVFLFFSRRRGHLFLRSSVSIGRRVLVFRQASLGLFGCRGLLSNNPSAKVCRGRLRGWATRRGILPVAGVLVGRVGVGLEEACFEQVGGFVGFFVVGGILGAPQKPEGPCRSSCVKKALTCQAPPARRICWSNHRRYAYQNYASGRG